MYEGSAEINAQITLKFPRRRIPLDFRIPYKARLYRVYKKTLNKPEIALRLCKAPQCTKLFIEIGCLGTDNVV